MPGSFLLCSSVLLFVCSTVSCIYLVHRTFYSLFCLLTFASFEILPPMDTLVFNWLFHWFLISQEQFLLIWRNVSFLNDKCELQRVPAPKHAVLHILFLYSIYENVCAPKTHGVFPYVTSFGL